MTQKTVRLPELTDRFAALLDEAGLSLADLLADLPRIRTELYQETYGDAVR